MFKTRKRRVKQWYNTAYTVSLIQNNKVQETNTNSEKGKVRNRGLENWLNQFSNQKQVSRPNRDNPDFQFLEDWQSALVMCKVVTYDKIATATLLRVVREIIWAIQTRTIEPSLKDWHGSLKTRFIFWRADHLRKVNLGETWQSQEEQRRCRSVRISYSSVYSNTRWKIPGWVAQRKTIKGLWNA